MNVATISDSIKSQTTLFHCSFGEIKRVGGSERELNSSIILRLTYLLHLNFRLISDSRCILFTPPVLTHATIPSCNNNPRQNHVMNKSTLRRGTWDRFRLFIHSISCSCCYSYSASILGRNPFYGLPNHLQQCMRSTKIKSQDTGNNNGI